MSRKLDDKFYGTKPLKVGIPESYPDKLLLQYHQFEEPKVLDLWETMRGKRLPENNKNIVFGIQRPPEEFTKYDFLDCPDGPAFVAHKRVIDKLNELCPEDFQALLIEIKNLDNKVEPLYTMIII